MKMSNTLLQPIKLSNQLSDLKPSINIQQFMNIHVNLFSKQILKIYDQQVSQSVMPSEEISQRIDRKWVKRIKMVGFYGLPLIVGYRTCGLPFFKKSLEGKRICVSKMCLQVIYFFVASNKIPLSIQIFFKKNTSSDCVFHRNW
uniref:Uncharacterized protein n=1 Tax=Boodleopsis pusilla TaxID=381415 RepID=A0A386AZI8_9CHLO|nr:hypothetical protein [Boodleopsis pusilla]AYC64852.1 hypothetical protein [Boodleopsis pusilla]